MKIFFMRNGWNVKGKVNVNFKMFSSMILNHVCRKVICTNVVTIDNNCTLPMVVHMWTRPNMTQTYFCSYGNMLVLVQSIKNRNNNEEDGMCWIIGGDPYVSKILICFFGDIYLIILPRRKKLVGNVVSRR